MTFQERRMLMLLFLGVPAGMVWLIGTLLVIGATVGLWRGDAVAAITLGIIGIAVVSLGWVMIMTARILSRSTKYTLAPKRLPLCAPLEIAVSLLFSVALGSLWGASNASTLGGFRSKSSRH